MSPRPFHRSASSPTPIGRRIRPWAGVLASLLVFGAWLAWGVTESGGARAGRAIPSVECGKPRKLVLRRLEDGSAQLLCAGRLLVRVHVPW